jgi:CBS domain containing-hemolysin-like protein
MDDPASSFTTLALFAADAPEITFFSVFWKISAVILLVLANGFFVASEFALVAVRKSRIESLAAEGSAAAERLLGLLNNLNAYISATQLGITLSSLALGWVGEPAVSALLEPVFFKLGEWSGIELLGSATVVHTISFIIAFAIITFLHIAFGELAPKTMALELSEWVCFWIALPLQIFYRTFYYPIRMLDWTGTRIVRAFGLHPSGEHGASYTEEEIRQLIRVSQESGHLNEEEQKLIDKVFEFSETTVREAMIPRMEIAAISDTLTLEEIARVFRRYGYSRLPVYHDSLDDVKGVIHSKDLLPYLLRPRSFRLDKVLQKPLYVVDTAKLEEVLRQMQAAKAHFGFVVDEHGGVEGIITLEDLLEEIVGDISDEHDEEVNEQISELGAGAYLLDGSLAVRDLNRRLRLKIPESEGYMTVAGFLMSEAGQLLEKGAKVRFNGHVFTVEKADKRRILEVKMQSAANKESAE